MAAAFPVAVDVVVLTVAHAAGSPDGVEGDARLRYLAVRRDREPFPGRWALPGRILDNGEELDAAAHTAYRTATGADRPRHLEQLATFGDPARDPRGRTVSVSYLALVPGTVGAAHGPPARDPARWRDVTSPGMPPAAPPGGTGPPDDLAFDHALILSTGVERLRGKLGYANVAFGLLPDEFTLSELQEVYEAVLSTKLDKRNFRKKVLGLGLVTETPHLRRGAHRPAQLYRFVHREPTIIATAAIA